MIIDNICDKTDIKTAGAFEITTPAAWRGYDQEWGKDAVEMKPGDCSNIPAGVRHWHGAAPDSRFAHLAVEIPGVNASLEWLEAAAEEQCENLK